VGLFSWLFGKRAPERVAVRDLVWLAGVGRARGLVKELKGHVYADRSVLLLAHFPSTLAALGPKLIDSRLPHEPIPEGLTPEAALRLAANGEPRVLFGLVRNLRLPEFPAAEDAPESPLPVLLAERHFLRSHDERVTEFAGGLGGRAEIAVHVALDDELMKVFAGQWVTDMLKRLGMKDDEMIDSPMVTRRIRKAQDQIRAKLATEEVPADSPLEWIQRNARP
jgi:hypothetical protein